MVIGITGWEPRSQPAAISLPTVRFSTATTVSFTTAANTRGILRGWVSGTNFAAPCPARNFPVTNDRRERLASIHNGLITAV